MLDVKTRRSGTRRAIAKTVVAGALVALPMGLFAAPATAERFPNPTNRSWQNDCDHNGQWRWQQDRGRWSWSDCDNNHGNWQWQGDNNGHGAWRWQRY